MRLESREKQGHQRPDRQEFVCGPDASRPGLVHYDREEETKTRLSLP